MNSCSSGLSTTTPVPDDSVPHLVKNLERCKPGFFEDLLIEGETSSRNSRAFSAEVYIHIAPKKPDRSRQNFGTYFIAVLTNFPVYSFAFFSR